VNEQAKYKSEHVVAGRSDDGSHELASLTEGFFKINPNGEL
jgi:hypothetical protein